MCTIEEKHRTCSYCVKLFPTQEKFAEHWNKCPVRIKEGYIPDPNPPRIKVGFNKEGKGKYPILLQGTDFSRVLTKKEAVRLANDLLDVKRKLEK